MTVALNIASIVLSLLVIWRLYRVQRTLNHLQTEYERLRALVFTRLAETKI
jgi:hypothetical protein